MSDPRRALIVIDVQNEYVTGRLRVEYPEVHGSLARIGRAMDVAHATGIPIAVIQHHAMGAGASLFAKGSAGWGLHETVSRRPYDVRVEKTQPSALAGTGLGAWLRARAIDTLTVAGYMTHNCDDATIRHAVHSGFAVEFLADAAGAVSYWNAAGGASAVDIHRAFIVVLQSRFAAVTTTDAWIDSLRTGTPLARDTILASHERGCAEM